MPPPMRPPVPRTRPAPTRAPDRPSRAAHGIPRRRNGLAQDVGRAGILRKDASPPRGAPAGGRVAQPTKAQNRNAPYATDVSEVTPRATTSSRGSRYVQTMRMAGSAPSSASRVSHAIG